ncbi:MAG: hypothetical protein V2J10_03605, partial [Wenzhouxiangella sp.]|nr:hypothetical protein [Wenzhouxiangella sp.]
ADRQDKQNGFDRIDDPAEAIAVNVARTVSVATSDPVIAWTLIKSSALRSAVITSANDPLERMIRAGTEAGRFDVACPSAAVLAIRGSALAVIQGILNETVAADVAAQFQELVLRMLGLDTEEAANVAARARTRHHHDTHSKSATDDQAGR